MHSSIVLLQSCSSSSHSGDVEQTLVDGASSTARLSYSVDVEGTGLKSVGELDSEEIESVLLAEVLAGLAEQLRLTAERKYDAVTDSVQMKR